MPASPEKPASFSRRQVLSTTLLALLGTTGCSDSSDDGVGPDGVVVVDFWHGQTDTGKDAIDALINEFNRTHPLIRVEGGGGGVTPDSMLQKVTAGLASGSYPDIAYIFGSDLARISRSPKVADLTNALQSTTGAQWTDFWKPARDAVTIDGRTSAAHALLDALCVVYNKKLFDAAASRTRRRAGPGTTSWPSRNG